MQVLGGVLIATLVCLSLSGGWQLVLRSTSAARHWREEVRRGTGGLKDGPQLPGKWRPRGQFSPTERGSLEALGCSCLLALVFALGLQALVWQQRLQQVRAHLRESLCLKAMILETHQMVRRVNTLNAAIVAGEVSNWALILVGIGVATRPQWEQVKRALQLAQNAQWLKSQAEFIRLTKNGCAPSLPFLATPYRWSGGFERAADGRALLRSSQRSWSFRTPLDTYRVALSIPSALRPQLNWQVR